MKPSFVDKIINRVGKADPGQVKYLLNQLAKDKNILEKVFNALEEGVLVVKRNGEIIYFNKSVNAFFGLNNKKVQLDLIQDIIIGLDWDSLTKSSAHINRDMEILKPQRRIINFYLTLLDNNNNKKENDDNDLFLMLVRDVTKKRKDILNTIESEKLSVLTLLAASVAHELGNPLNSLDIHMQLLESRFKNNKIIDDKSLKLVQNSREEIKRLDTIIKQFLGAIRPSKISLENISINKLILESIRFLEQELKNRNILIKLELSSQIPYLRLDSNQIKQAFYNLINNSMQAINQNGEIKIISKIKNIKNEQYLLLTIKDNGKGMIGETVNKVYEPYFTTKVTGSGLGMLIVRRIIHDNGGDIEIKSEKNKGTKITLRFTLNDKSVRLLK